MCVARRIPQKDQPDHPFGGSFSIAFQIALCNHQAETMATASTLHFRRHITLSGSLAILFLLVLALPVALQAQRVLLATGVAGDTTAAVDAGTVPASQPLQLTVRLAMTADRSAALDQLLTNQTTAKSASYHQWLTPKQFASRFGATDDQIAATTAWLESQGLSVDAVAPSGTRMTVSGTASQVESAFAVTFRRYQVANALYVANSTTPSIPLEVASLIAGVSGLNEIPAATPATVAAVTSAGPRMIAAPNAANQSVDPFAATASAIDANAASILTFSTEQCAADLPQSDYQAYHDLFRQANAQGITVLATSGCGTRGTGSFPASLAEVTALTVSPTTSQFVPIETRPSWQVAPGLPDDASRYEPDLTTTSVAAFAQTISTIVQQTGIRQGNINAILYNLAPMPGLYTQPDATPSTVAGSWEKPSGLGVVDLATLLKVYPRATGAIATTTTLISSSYAVGYGTPITLTSTVTPASYASANPTGVMTFTSSTQGTIGSSPLNGGTATFTVSNLGVGTYNLTANYSGDTNYAASTSTSSVVITVSIVNASLTASIAPSQNVPYGSTATVTATVALPNSSASPSGTVSSQIEGITGAVYSAVLSPNPGGNTATANINIDAPPPSTTPYTVQTTCAGNQNFQCQTPVNLTFTTTKGNTSTTISVTPAAPLAGQPITITATINNNGNGKLNYTFSGNVIFYDNGKQIASAAVGTNQATLSTSLSGAIAHNITATYSGDANWNPSTAAAQAVTPTLLPSTVTLSSNVTNTSGPLAGMNVVLTATVFTIAVNSVGPTGTVTFFDTYNGAIITLGVGTLTPNGPNASIAVMSTTNFAGGTHSIYAAYNGDGTFSSANSPTLPLNFADYNLTMIPQTLTISRGQNGQVVMLLGAVAGFNGTVTFGCTPPASTETACSFSPVSLIGGGSTTMTITTTAPVTPSTTGPAQHAALQRNWNLAAGATFAMLFFVVPRRRRALPTLLLLLCGVCLTANLGCGATMTDPSGPSDPGSPLGTQIFTITAAGSNGVSTTRHNYQYQVTIQ
jgi:trimeric autotransporter adhesin